ncbi:MAG: DUF4081 domain-containing protein, partial [Candidatus Nanopelagicales bacterium]|nr:DUF4081 domain-containing protein [Candidatus Nanopelagicales bacterium]
MTGSVRLLTGADAPALRALLATDPVSYAMVGERLQSIGLGTTLGAEVWGWFEGDQLRSAMYLGANVVPIGAVGPAVEGFAARARVVTRRCSSIVGPAPAVLAFYDLVAESWGPPDPRVRQATLDDLELLFPACVAMFTEELGISPLVPDGGSAYRRRVAT